ncbi:hypothetical protein HDU96_004016 [Phlyctochytrium bullatum]|nr:hypothetical protein HDU96_004016 [Phlyctochytrium bullatum]
MDQMEWTPADVIKNVPENEAKKEYSYETTKEGLAEETVKFYGFIKKTYDVEIMIKKFQMAFESIETVESLSEAIDVNTSKTLATKVQRG